MEDSRFFSDWGNARQAGHTQANVQNQADIADWPCFSKYYVTFPLNGLPRGLDVHQAELILHQFGQGGGSDWNPPATRSLVQASLIDQDWSEQSMTWNTAPLAAENLGQGWVDLMTEPLVWPGVARKLDVSLAFERAYRAGKPLRLALYSADLNYHSGKYFSTSDSGDWNAAARPTLKVTLGE
jgi:hypothetical protein